MPMSNYKRRMRDQVGPMMIQTVGVWALIFDAAGRLLLQQRADNHRWGLVGGELEPGEYPADALIREVWEETGLHVQPEHLHGVYSGPDWAYTHPNGDVDAPLCAVWRCRVLAGTLHPDGQEVHDLAYFSRDAITDLSLNQPDAEVIAQAFVRQPEALYRPPTWAAPADGSRDGGQSAYALALRARVGKDVILTPAVVGLVFNADGHVLLQKRADNGQWANPAGALEPLESPADAVLREIWEETGVIAAPVRVAYVYGGPDYMFHHPNSGDHIAVVNATFECRPVGGAPTPDGLESTDVAYFPPDELAQLDDLHPNSYTRIMNALANPTGAGYHPATWTPNGSK
jgi:8-oxo-dGTP diphosphatase